MVAADIVAFKPSFCSPNFLLLFLSLGYPPIRIIARFFLTLYYYYFTTFTILILRWAHRLVRDPWWMTDGWCSCLEQTLVASSWTSTSWWQKIDDTRDCTIIKTRRMRCVLHAPADCTSDEWARGNWFGSWIDTPLFLCGVSLDCAALLRAGGKSTRH